MKNYNEDPAEPNMRRKINEKTYMFCISHLTEDTKKSTLQKQEKYCDTEVQHNRFE